MSSRKPRPPKGPLQTLTKSQRSALAAWLRRHTYKEAVRLMWEQFGVKTSEGALSNWYARHMPDFRQPGRPSMPAAGIGVTIKCHRLGEMTLAVYPLPFDDDGGTGAANPEPAATVRAGGVEITALQGALPGEMQLVVKPTAAPQADAARERPEGVPSSNTVQPGGMSE